MLIHSKNISSVHPSILRDLFKMKHAAIKFFYKILITWGNDDCDMISREKKVQTFTSNMISTMLGEKSIKK